MAAEKQRSTGERLETPALALSEQEVGIGGLKSFLSALPPYRVSGEERDRRPSLGDIATRDGSHGVFFPIFVDYAITVARARAETNGTENGEWVNSAAFIAGLAERRGLTAAALQRLQSARLAKLQRLHAERQAIIAEPGQPKQPSPARLSLSAVMRPLLDKSEVFGVITETYTALADNTHTGAAEIMADVGYAFADAFDPIEALPAANPQITGAPGMAAA